MLSEIEHLPEVSALNNGIDFATEQNQSLRNASLGHLTMDDVVAHHNNIKPSNAMVVSTNLGELLAKNETTILRVVPLSQRIDMQCVIDGFPTKREVKRFTASQLVQKVIDENLAKEAGPLLHLPANAKTTSNYHFGNAARVHQPTTFLKVLRFNKHLKSCRSLEEALDDGLDAAIEDDDLEAAVRAHRTRKPPHPATIKRGRIKLDGVAMNITRRKLQDIALNRPGDVESCHVFTDGSPVTGTEVQGNSPRPQAANPNRSKC
jgi:hypothetical protein